MHGYGSKGKVAKASPAKSTKRDPEGLDKKTTYPLTKSHKLKGKGASRVLKGTDRRKVGKGVTGDKPKSLEGKYF